MNYYYPSRLNPSDYFQTSYNLATYGYPFHGVVHQPIAPAIRKCDYCGTKYYEKQEENKALTCPSCGGPQQ